MGEPAGCPGAPVGGHQARNTDRRARGNSVRPSGRGPQRSGLWTGSYPKDRRRHEQPAPTLPPARRHARTPARPRQRQLRRGSDPTRRDPHRGHFHARATIPRMRWLVGILWGRPRPQSAEGHKHARSAATCARPSRVRLHRVIRRRSPARPGGKVAGAGRPPASASAGSVRGLRNRLPGREAEYFKMGAAVMPSQDLGQGAGPVHDGTLADLAAGDRPRPLTFARFLRGRCGCGRRQSRLDLCVMRLLGAGLAVVPRTGKRSRCAGLAAEFSAFTARC